MALKLGPDRLYQYIRAFRLRTRTGIELPGETRGLLRPVSRWQPASIGYSPSARKWPSLRCNLFRWFRRLPMAAFILPPHVLMPQSRPPKICQKSARPQAAAVPFSADEDLPNPLPDGAHRVITTLTAAQMRKMMEGVVLFGTGKEAQLDGYSSGGKTGTAQKIDPATHRYSKTMHIASFAGFAPVNNPVIAVAVIIDTPKGQYYGSASPRRCLPRWRNRFWNTWACRTTSH